MRDRDSATSSGAASGEERWASRTGSFTPCLGADGRAPRGPREKESAAELFARTREIPGPTNEAPPGSTTLSLIVQWGTALPLFLAAQVVFGHRDVLGGLLAMWMAATAVALIHTGLLARTRVPAWARWAVVILAVGAVVAMVVFDVGRTE